MKVEDSSCKNIWRRGNESRGEKIEVEFKVEVKVKVKVNPLWPRRDPHGRRGGHATAGGGFIRESQKLCYNSLNRYAVFFSSHSTLKIHHSQFIPVGELVLSYPVGVMVL